MTRRNLTSIIRAFGSGLVLLLFSSGAQEFPRSAGLHEDRQRNGYLLLSAFSPAVEPALGAVVKLAVDGSTVALGTVVDASGLVITKASEIKPGRLTCQLPNGGETEASVVLVNESNDIALLRVNAPGLTPIQWANAEAVVGQWAVTPGLETVPEAAGIISVPPRRIPHPRAFIGVQLDVSGNAPRIEQIMEGFGAGDAGLEAGDVIRAVNDRPVETRLELTTTLSNFREGQTVKLLVQRGEEEFEASVRMMVTPARNTAERENPRQQRARRFVGEVSDRAEGFDLAIQHDTVLLPWQCGGPLLNLEGEAIGLNIARAGRIASYALPASLVREIVQDFERRQQLEVGHDTPDGVAE